MFKNHKQLIIGILIGAILFGGLSAIATNQTIEAFVSDIKVKLSGQPLALDNPPIIYQDRTYLPVRQIAEALGKNVEYKEATRTVEISDLPIITSTDGYIAIYPDAELAIAKKYNYNDRKYRFGFDKETKTAFLQYDNPPKWVDHIVIKDFNFVLISGKPGSYISIYDLEHIIYPAIDKFEFENLTPKN